MRKLLLALLVLLAAYIGYAYLTLHWMNQALLSNDKPALERLVDFPEVRKRLKAEIKLGVMDKTQELTENRPVLGNLSAALAGLVAPALVDSAVDTMVTPEAILSNEEVVEHRKAGKSFSDFVTYAFFSAPAAFTIDLKDPERPDSPTLTVIMRLTGLRWRVVAIRLPPADTWFAEPAK